VNKIFDRIQIVYNQQSTIQNVYKYITTRSFDSSAPLQRFYKEWFNLVDLEDGYWYDTQDAHKNQSWKSKMIFAIMLYFIVNVWTISIQEEFKSLIDFRFDLAEYMVDL